MRKLCLALFLLLAVAAAVSQTSVTSNLTAQGSTCTATSTSCLFYQLPQNAGAISVVLSGTFSGTVQFEASADNGSTWVNEFGTPLPSGLPVSSATGTGTWTFAVAGMTHFRARVSTYSSGTVSATIQASLANAIADVILAQTTGLDPCNSTATTKTSVAINISAAATSALVAASGSKAIYVCEYSFSISQVVTTANTLSFGFSTVAACASGVTALTGLYGAGGVTAAAPIVILAGGSGTLMTAPASNGLCVTTAIGASGSFQGVLTYVQQ